MEVEAFVNFDSFQSIAQNDLREILRAHQRQIAREGKQQNGVNSCLFQKPEFFSSGREQLQAGIRAQNSHRMRFETHSNRLGRPLARAENNLVEHPAVRAMYSVKVADADQSWAKVRRNVGH